MDHANRFTLAVAVSLAAHSLLLLAIPVRKLAEPGMVVMAEPPLSVRILEPSPQPQPLAAPPVAAARPEPRATPPRELSQLPRPPAPTVSADPPPREPEPAVPARPTSQPPALDMLAMIEARRERRRAAEEGRRRPQVEAPQADAATRNLETLTAAREGVGGVFQVIRIGTRRGEFAFNGWRPSARWREYYEVEAKPGERIEIAMVRRMIQLIRSHYSGDFRWESHRLGRVIVLSARPEDNAELEDFLMREFFGTPVVKE